MNNQYIYGCYYYPNSSQSIHCSALISEQEIQLIDDSNDPVITTSISCCELSPPIPGLAHDLILKNQGRFVPSDIYFRWPFADKKHSWAEKLEKSFLLILLSILLVPLLLWLILYRGIPAIAVYSVEIAPPSMVEEMGQQSLTIIKKTLLSPTTLPAKKQAELQQQWHTIIDTLNLESTKYRLFFYQSDYFGANAFALPSGHIVVTDELVELLDKQPDALRAILLHEIGHVVHHHGIRLTAQAAASTVVLAVIFGDLEGITEVVLGSGSSFLQQAFSRDMEREADQYAIDQLVALGYSSEDFANAIMALQKAIEEEGSAKSTWLKYLSTHPSSEERIQHAKQYQAQ